MGEPSIVEVMQSYGIELLPAGKELKALCPFHEDKNPSLFVNPAKNSWHCFGCQAGGGPVQFVMAKEGMDQRGGGEFLRRRHSRRQESSKRYQLDKWVRITLGRVKKIMLELRDKLALAEEIKWTEEVEALHREYEVMFDLWTDLSRGSLLTRYRLFKNKEAIENILDYLE